MSQLEKLKNTETRTFRFRFKDKGSGVGVPAKEPPAWGVEDEDLCSIVPAGDGMSCKVLPFGPQGQTVLYCDAKVLIGQATVVRRHNQLIEITQDETILGEITADPPEPRKDP